MPVRILFLAVQLQPFLVSGICSLLSQYDVEIMVYAQKSDSNQLLDIPSSGKLKIFLYNYEPDTFFWTTAKEFKPDMVWCAGWMHLVFLNWVKAFRQSGAQTICAMDTQWKGSIKQHVFTRIAPLLIKNYFSHAWIPGKRQEHYALKLGFHPECILHHLYAPNTKLFQESFFLSAQAMQFTRRFLYVGRLEPHKIENLLLAFHQLAIEGSKPWRLQIVGDGSMKNHRLLNHQYIDCEAAMTQKKLLHLATQGGVFCLCSTDEPWGTVVQEFAAAGMPLLISKQCGSSEHFIQDNGYICDGLNVKSIQDGLQQFMLLSDKELIRMSAQSHQLGIATNSDSWAKELMSIVKIIL